MTRPLAIHHCTPEPVKFFGRAEELAILDEAFHGGEPSVVAFVGPGGQGKTAIVQTWLERFRCQQLSADGLFFWSFYRGKDVDLCLRELYRCVERLDSPPEVSASFCVDRMIPTIRNERWAILLDGTEVVQHETGSWFGRFVHPELGRLLEEFATKHHPGVVVLTSRFPVPELQQRKFARIKSLSALDRASAQALMRGLGVAGSAGDLAKATVACGCHAKAVELLSTYLVEFHQGQAGHYRQLPEAIDSAGAADEEIRVWRILRAFQLALSPESKDIIALATAFRHPPSEERLLQYFASQAVHVMLHEKWQRAYEPFRNRSEVWLPAQLEKLVQLRLLERVHLGSAHAGELVVDAHPLVRRGFEHMLGIDEKEQSAQARAGFLRGRPDRRPPQSLQETREEVELFHAYCDGQMWNDADSVFVALDNPKHRFLAPAFERDLLLRFFPGGDWRVPPHWSGFGRYRSLAICFELLGQWDNALMAYPSADAPLRGDALLALGELAELLATPQVAQPWQNLWRAYRAHALVLAGQTEAAIGLVRKLIPVDAYEWVHVFECLLRLDHLQAIDIRSVLYRPPYSREHRWSRLARERMRLDHWRICCQETMASSAGEMEADYRRLIEDYDRGGLPYERCLTRLGLARLLLRAGHQSTAGIVLETTAAIARRHGMKIMEADALEIHAEIAPRAQTRIDQLRAATGFRGPARP